MLDYTKILDRANTLMVDECGLDASDIRYMAPERLPRIESRQVRAAMRAIIEAINEADSWDHSTREDV